MSKQQKTIDVSGEGFYSHIIGDNNCHEGWCSESSGYPKPCECGGLIHADFGDEDYNEGYWLHTKCDKCGDHE